VVAVAVTGGWLATTTGELALAAVLGAFAVAMTARWPAQALATLIVFLPFQVTLLAFAYRVGAPAPFVRAASGVKEAILAGLLLLAIDTASRRRPRLDALDLLAIAFAVIATAYLILPSVAPSLLPTAPRDFGVRLLGWRLYIGIPIALFAARHIFLSNEVRRRLGRLVVRVAVVIAAIAVFEFLFSDAWNTIAVDALGVPAYKREVLGVFSVHPSDVRFYGLALDRSVVRVGSILFSPLTLGFYLLLGLGVTLRRVAGADRARSIGSAALVGAALVFTLTRSAALGAVAMTMVTFRNLPARTAPKARFGVLLACALVLLVPVSAQSGLADRTRSLAADDPSRQAHEQGLIDGVRTLVAAPLGLGLGTGAVVGARFGSQQVGSENSYLQVGNELGILGMLVFIALLVAVVRRLRRARAPDGDATLTLGVRTAFVGLALAGFFLHVWNDAALAWTLWALAGLALSKFPAPDPS